MGRVIAGKKRGLKLATLQGLQTRPSSDRLKEALFNILQDRIYASSFLDLYAGSGQIGIEALSREAATVCAVEHNDEACNVIKKNIEKAGFRDRYRLFKMDARKALKILSDEELSFDIVFMDPPYAEAERLCSRVFKLLFAGKLLKNNSLIIVECSSKDGDLLKNRLGELIEGECSVRVSKYGSSTIVIFELN